MNDKTLFYMIFLICQGKNEKKSFVRQGEGSGTDNRKNQRITEKTQIFSGKPLDKQGGVKYINHRMLALLNDEC